MVLSILVSFGIYASIWTGAIFFVHKFFKIMDKWSAKKFGDTISD